MENIIGIFFLLFIALTSGSNIEWNDEAKPVKVEYYFEAGSDFCQDVFLFSMDKAWRSLRKSGKKVC